MNDTPSTSDHSDFCQVELSSLLPLEYLNIVAAAVVTESGDPKRVESLKLLKKFAPSEVTNCPNWPTICFFLHKCLLDSNQWVRDTSLELHKRLSLDSQPSSVCDIALSLLRLERVFDARCGPVKLTNKGVNTAIHWTEYLVFTIKSLCEHAEYISVDTKIMILYQLCQATSGPNGWSIGIYLMGCVDPECSMMHALGYRFAECYSSVVSNYLYNLSWFRQIKMSEFFDDKTTVECRVSLPNNALSIIFYSTMRLLANLTRLPAPLTEELIKPNYPTNSMMWMLNLEMMAEGVPGMTALMSSRMSSYDAMRSALDKLIEACLCAMNVGKLNEKVQGVLEQLYVASGQVPVAEALMSMKYNVKLVQILIRLNDKSLPLSDLICRQLVLLWRNDPMAFLTGPCAVMNEMTTALTPLCLRAEEFSNILELLTCILKHPLSVHVCKIRNFLDTMWDFCGPTLIKYIAYTSVGAAYLASTNRASDYYDIVKEFEDSDKLLIQQLLQHPSTRRLELMAPLIQEIFVPGDSWMECSRTLGVMMASCQLDALLVDVKSYINNQGEIDVDEDNITVDDCLLGDVLISLLLRRVDGGGASRPQSAIAAGYCSISDYLRRQCKLKNIIVNMTKNNGNESEVRERLFCWISRFLSVTESDISFWNVLNIWSSNPSVNRIVWSNQEMISGLITCQCFRSDAPMSADPMPIIDVPSLLRTAMLVNTQKFGAKIPGPDLGLISDQQYILAGDMSPPSSLASLAKTRNIRSPSTDSVHEQMYDRNIVTISTADGLGLGNVVWKFIKDSEFEYIPPVASSYIVSRFYLEGSIVSNTRPGSERTMMERTVSGDLEYLSGTSSDFTNEPRSRSGSANYVRHDDGGGGGGVLPSTSAARSRSGSTRLPPLRRYISSDVVTTRPSPAQHIVDCGMSMMRMKINEIGNWRDSLWDVVWNSEITEGNVVGLSWLLACVLSLMQDSISVERVQSAKKRAPNDDWNLGWIRIWTNFSDRTGLYNHGSRLAPTSSPGEILSRLLRPRNAVALTAGDIQSPGTREFADYLTDWSSSSSGMFWSGVPEPEERDIWEYTVAGVCNGCCVSLGLPLPNYDNYPIRSYLPRKPGQSCSATCAAVEAMVTIIHPDIANCFISYDLPISAVVNNWISKCFINVLEWTDVLRSVCWRWLSGDQGDVLVCMAIFTYLKPLVPWLAETGVLHALMTCPSRYLSSFNLCSFVGHVGEWQAAYGKLIVELLYR